MTPFIITVWGLAAIAATAVALYKAPRVGRNGQRWAFWSFLIPPAVCLLFLLPPNTLSAGRSQPPQRTPIDYDD
jgi:hypothetical protein